MHNAPRMRSWRAFLRKWHWSPTSRRNARDSKDRGGKSILDKACYGKEDHRKAVVCEEARGRCMKCQDWGQGQAGHLVWAVCLAFCSSTCPPPPPGQERWRGRHQGNHLKLLKISLRVQFCLGGILKGPTSRTAGCSNGISCSPKIPFPA